MRVEAVRETVEEAQVPEARTVAPERSCTVELVSQLRVRVGVVSVVRLSVEDVPESELASRSGVLVVVGAVVSIWILMVDDSVEMFPAGSVCCALRV